MATGWDAYWAAQRADIAHRRASDPRDPRPDSELRGRDSIFRDHNCSRCRDGEKACVKGDPRRCDWPHARND